MVFSIWRNQFMVTLKTYRAYVLLFFIMIIIFFIGNCKKDTILGHDDTLSMNRTSYTGTQLKINGYYYQLQGGVYYTLYCFYRNGVLVYLGGGYNQSQLGELENNIQNGSYYNTLKNYKDNWGVFIIQNSNIKFEKWEPGSGGPLHSYIREGTILNDTTFHITKSMRSNGSEVTSENDTYHFKKFSPKPDSTNKFVP